MREIQFWFDPAAPLTSSEPRLAFGRARLMLDHYRDSVETIDGEGPIAEGLRFFRSMATRRPGHSGVLIEDGDNRLLIGADITHSPMLQLTYPDWTIGRDKDPAMAGATRHKLLAKIAASGMRIAGSHHVGTGRSEPAEIGFRFSAETV